MQQKLPTIKAFATLQGRELWEDYELTGRRVYVSPVSGKQFLAHGVHEPSGQLVFAVTGTIGGELKTFYLQMVKDGAHIVGCFGPKVGTDDSGKPLPGSVALEDFFRSPPIGDEIVNPKGEPSGGRSANGPGTSSRPVR